MVTAEADAAAPLVVDNLVKHYRVRGQVAEAVRGVSFAVGAGECFGLLGPNGAGKSTTINCLTGFFPPTSGEVRLNGHHVHAEPKAARRWLGVCPQEDTLDTDFSVLDQMIRHATFYRIPVAEAKRTAEGLLKRFHLADRADSLVETLSGGMRRKLQVARALVSHPKVLVLDEPSTGLDPDARRTLWDILVACRSEGLAILLSTHYMEEAERLCDRVAILHLGRILDIDTPRRLIEKHVPAPVVEEEIRPGVRWQRPANLEDVYLKLTGTRLIEGAPSGESHG